MTSSTNQKQQRRRARSGQKSGKLAPSRNSTVSAPSAQNRSSFQRKGKNSNSTRYKECERIGTISGSVAFANILNIPCNPALPGSFPWLAGHASLYEKYKVHSITYRYKNLKGTSTDGNIIMSFDYDTLDDPPPDAISQSQSTVWIDGAPWRIFEMKVPTDGITRFTRTADVTGSDLKTYDFGRLHVSAEGCSDTSSHGYLEIEYDIECFDKQKSTIVATFNSTRETSFSTAIFESTGGITIDPGTVIFDKVNEVEVIPYDLFSGTFAPSEGYYRIDLVNVHPDFLHFQNSWKLRQYDEDSNLISTKVIEDLHTFIVYFPSDNRLFNFEQTGIANRKVQLCITRVY